MNDPFQLTEDIANSRPGEVWEYTWRNPTGSATNLLDGELVVVVHMGEIESRYDRYGEDVSNWADSYGSDFGFDTPFRFARHFPARSQVKIHPPDGASVIRERRPFVIARDSQKLLRCNLTFRSHSTMSRRSSNEFEAVRVSTNLSIGH